MRWHGNKAKRNFEYCLFCFHVIASRFTGSSEEEIRQLLKEKLLEKGIEEPMEKSEITRVS